MINVADKKTIKLWIDDAIRAIQKPIIHTQQTIQRWTNTALVTFFGNLASLNSIAADGTDQTANITAALARSGYNGLIIDLSGTVTISGTVTVPTGKYIQFANNCIVDGAGTINFNGGIVICEDRKRCFGSSITITGLGNNIKSVMWFGGVSDAYYTAPSPTDNYPFIIKALNSGSVRTKVYFPHSTTLVSLGNWYYCSTRLSPNYQVEIFGDGVGKSVILFPGDQLGINFLWGSSFSYLHDIEIRGAYQSYSNGFNSTTAHGILVNTNVLMERIRVSNFDGDGVRFYGNVGAPLNVSHGGNRYTVLLGSLNIEPGVHALSSTYWTLIGAGGVDATYVAWSAVVDYGYSNTNNAKFRDSQITGCGRHGMSTQGGDGNNVRSEAIDATANARANFAGLDFLGNYWGSLHAASAAIDHGLNKSVIRYRAAVSVGGNRYRAIAASTLIQPGVTSGWASYWVLIEAGGIDSTYQAWSAVRAYTAPLFYIAVADNLNIEPQVTSGWATTWTQKAFSPSFYNEWFATTQFYWGGIGYYVSGDNQLGNFDTCYAEQDQIIVLNASNNLFIGGYLGLYGGFVGALGMRLGFLTSQNFQAGGEIGCQLLPTGLKFKNATQELELKGDVNGFDLVWQGLDDRGIRFKSPLAGAAIYGLDQDDNRGNLAVDEIQMSIDGSASNYCGFSAGTTAPTSGNFRRGHIRFNVGTDDDISHWKCTTASVAGNGGSWTTYYVNEAAP